MLFDIADIFTVFHSYNWNSKHVHILWFKLGLNSENSDEWDFNEILASHKFRAPVGMSCIMYEDHDNYQPIKFKD